MKKKVILSSILTIALCISLIAGSTFALFTSTSQVNVAVTSGKVEVVATASQPEYGSTLEAGKLDESTATLEGNVITIDKMVPGDFVKFNITITNNSNVTIKYRTVFSLVADGGLWSGLKLTIGNDTLIGTTASAWETLAPGSDPIAVPVTVALPESAGNEYQEKTCSFAYTVEAVQGNAETSDDDGVFYVTDVATLRAAVAFGGKIVLANDITFTDADMILAGKEPLETMLVVAKDASIDLNGMNLQYLGGGTCYHAIYVTNGATLDLYDTSDDQTGSVYANDPEGTWIVEAHGESTVNIYGGHYKNESGCVIYKNDGHVNIYGGTFENEGDYKNLINLGNSHASYGPIVISGGSFKNFKPGVTNGSENEVASGYKVVQDGDWYNVVPE